MVKFVVGALIRCQKLVKVITISIGSLGVSYVNIPFDNTNFEKADPLRIHCLFSNLVM